MFAFFFTTSLFRVFMWLGLWNKGGWEVESGLSGVVSVEIRLMLPC